jgi:hypothetical protein
LERGQAGWDVGSAGIQRGRGWTRAGRGLAAGVVLGGGWFGVQTFAGPCELVKLQGSGKIWTPNQNPQHKPLKTQLPANPNQPVQTNLN